MTFKPYITYDEYVELGGNLPEDVFPRLLRKAQRYLDYITFNRIKLLPSIPDEVKEVLADFVDKFNKKEEVSGSFSSASSYSNGVESVTFKENASTQFNNELNKFAIQILPDYLTARSVNFDVVEYLQSKNNNS
jgi:hypothetical protein